MNRNDFKEFPGNKKVSLEKAEPKLLPASTANKIGAYGGSLYADWEVVRMFGEDVCLAKDPYGYMRYMTITDDGRLCPLEYA